MFLLSVISSASMTLGWSSVSFSSSKVLVFTVVVVSAVGSSFFLQSGLSLGHFRLFLCFSVVRCRMVVIGRLLVSFFRSSFVR